MAMWLETDSSSNVNISSATAVGAYTATGDALVLPQLLVDQAAGGGDYVYYVTLQVNGAGSSYVFGPKTTHTAAAGETALGSQGGLVFVRAGDIVTVYVDGLAGDTTTPDVTVRWAALPLPSAAAGAAGGLALVGSTMVPDAAGTRSALGMAAADLDTQLGTLATAAALATVDGIVDSILEDTGTTLPAQIDALPTATADAIADEPMAGHTTPGTAAAAWAAAAGDPWASDLVDGDYNDPDTAGYIIARLAGIDVSAVTHVTASNAGEITIKRTLTLAAVVSGLTIPADWVACYWTVKRSTDDLDAYALVQILVSNPGDPDDGVQVLMGTALEDESDGSLVVNQALGTVTIALGDASTALLDEAVELVWDIKVHTATGKTQPGAGTATITTTVTRT